MIEVTKLTKRYGAFTAVDDISFSIEPGEICGFLGPNGAGKTTTMRILTGFMPPTDGRVTVAGFDVFSDMIEIKKRVGYLPESTPLYTEMRVSEYLDFVAEIKGLKSSAKKRKVADVMEATHITDRQRSLISSLSKGYRQRVGLAQALLNDPETLILDEPSIGLDPKQITEIRSMIKDLAGKRTVILSTHILPEAQMICSRVMIINKGKLVAAGTPESLAQKFEESGKIVATIKAPSEEAFRAVRNVEGASEVSMTKVGEEIVKFYISPTKDKNLRKSLARLVVDKDWELLELKEASLSLEEVYLKLVTQESEPAGLTGK
ncbi:Gliding motility-associated ABC transporter ATP-binding protein GldA [hydrothermal vent metagenome]|uniref:Gliding motility-associated ABC transporter ATP-binding protein GldA n=1 Tax=hydrothermal vent metagenome TaxID=652676 RepID=A0A3B1CVB3_9ZZZZ